MTLQVQVVDHPLVAQKLTTLRDVATSTREFRRLADELMTMLVYEATRELPTVRIPVRTPVAVGTGVAMAAPAPMVVPVLRAGLGMLDAMIRLLPWADVGFVGVARDEATLVASTYTERIPAALAGRDVYVLDPMLATGGTLSSVGSLLFARGAGRVHAVCLIAAPEGVERIRRDFGERSEPVRLLVAAIDQHLDDRGYIVPGLGDAGDRLFGPV